MPSVVRFTVSQQALGARCVLDVLAEHAGQVEEGLLTLAELDRVWGPGGELRGLSLSAPGTAVVLGWESLLLLGLHPQDQLVLDLRRRTGTRTGPLVLPALGDRHALASRLVAHELEDAGCLAVCVTVGHHTTPRHPSPQGPRSQQTHRPE